jgi:hypothetical protein
VDSGKQQLAGAPRPSFAATRRVRRPWMRLAAGLNQLTIHLQDHMALLGSVPAAEGRTSTLPKPLPLSAGSKRQHAAGRQ